MTRTERDVVSFSADFPDDSQWDEDGTEIVVGGRRIAETIRRKLEQQGICCLDVSQHEAFGWGFDTIVDENRVWILLTASSEGWLFQLIQRTSLLRRLLGLSKKGAFERLQTKLREILTADKRFSQVSWYTRDGYDRGMNGVDTPFLRLR